MKKEDSKNKEEFRRIKFIFNNKRFDYLRPSQMRNVPLKYKSVRGYIPSLKNYMYPEIDHLKNLVLNYESQLERDFLYILDHDSHCLDLQTQPCLIEYTTITGKKANLYPDVWAVFSDGREVLFEVKPENKLKKITENKNWSRRIKAIQDYCEKMGWTYQFITEKKIKCVRLNNIKDLLVSAKHYSPTKVDLLFKNFNLTLEKILKEKPMVKTISGNRE
ncbi:MAG: TnsA endonuclease N-terminal domain-containing protein [Promethearchaeota archaeon]